MITTAEATKRMIALGYALRGEPVPDVIELPPPQATHYEPLYIPDWWHEEYLKSLEPEPPFDLDTFLVARFDDIAVGFTYFFQCFCAGLVSATAFLFGSKRIR